MASRKATKMISLEPKALQKRFRSTGHSTGMSDKTKRKKSNKWKSNEWRGAYRAPPSYPPLLKGSTLFKVRALHQSNSQAALVVARNFVDEELGKALEKELAPDQPFWLRRWTFGKPVPRLQAFFALDPSKAKLYNFGGNTYTPLPLAKAPPSLCQATKLYCEATGIKANYLVLNCYEDEWGSILPHFDTDSLDKPIGCLSLGAEREFSLHPAKGSRTLMTTRLPDRSLSLMLPDDSSTPRHSVPKAKLKTGMRISITWRVW